MSLIYDHEHEDQGRYDYWVLGSCLLLLLFCVFTFLAMYKLVVEVVSWL